MKKKFTDLVDFVGGKPASFEGTKSYISTGALKGTTISKEDTELVEFDNRPSRADLEVKKGDVLFAKMAFTDKRILIDDDTSNYIYSTGFFAVRAKPNVITTECLYYLLNSKTFKDQKDTNSTGATQKAITNSGLKKIYLRIPNYNNQREIAEILSNVEKIISFKERQLKEYDQLIKSRFVEMFGEVEFNTNNYKLVKYGEVFELNAGGTPSRRKTEYWENGTISWIGSNLCQNNIIYENDGQYITEEGYKNSSARLFPVGTVLVALVGATIGKTALLKFETTTNQNVLGIRNIRESGFNPYFVYYYTQGLYNRFINIGGGGFSMASKKFISDLDIALVKLEDQNEFAEFVQQVDKLKFEVLKLLGELR